MWTGTAQFEAPDLGLSRSRPNTPWGASASSPKQALARSRQPTTGRSSVLNTLAPDELPDSSRLILAEVAPARSDRGREHVIYCISEEQASVYGMRSATAFSCLPSSLVATPTVSDEGTNATARSRPHQAAGAKGSGIMEAVRIDHETEGGPRQ
jgi:hypothetical protein